MKALDMAASLKIRPLEALFLIVLSFSMLWFNANDISTYLKFHLGLATFDFSLILNSFA